MSKKAIVIGSGFGGMSAATYLAKAGFEVTILEKNSWVGGRAQSWSKDGFRFDMGPSWYLLPDQFDRYFADFGHKTSDFYQLTKLSPSYKIFHLDNQVVEVPNNPQEAEKFFESIEVGAGDKFKKYIDNAKFKYYFAINKFVYRQFDSILDFANIDIIKSIFQLNIFSSLENIIYKNFKSPLLRKILGYPAVFLGGFPNRIPAVYSLLNWVDFGLGAWYPQGGFQAVSKGFEKLAVEQGVKFELDDEVVKLNIESGKVVSVITKNGLEYIADVVVTNADYQWVDENLLGPEYQNYDSKKWDSRYLAASCLNYYIGLDVKIKNLLPHTFIFDGDWDAHGDSIYGKGGGIFTKSDNTRSWPKKPLIYIHTPSKVDKEVAPENGEALFVLVPIASGLEDTPEKRKEIFEFVLEKLEKYTGQNIRDHIKVYRDYCIKDFQNDYHAYKGNAFGLGQTLFQTASFRPKNYSKKLSNLFFSGQYTLPGTGTAMSMISGKVTADRIIKKYK